MEERNNIKVSSEVMALKLIADSMDTSAEKAALVLQSLSDEDLDFVVDTLLQSEDENEIERASAIFAKTLEGLN